LSQPVDTGFDAVLAGEVYEHPPEEPQVKRLPRFDSVNPPISELAQRAMQPDPILQPDVTATVTPPGLTPAGVQAAKALVALPNMTFSDLARLARDIAMDIKERHVVYKEYGLSTTQYEFLEANNDFFRNALQAACIEWHAPLSTGERIKVEAAAILEDSLLGLGARMRNNAEGLPGVIEAAKFFGKLSGVGEREAGAAGAGERFTINIDLGGDQKINITATSAAPEPAPANNASPARPEQSGDGAGQPRQIPSLPEGQGS
jgi:hypothetical protein